MDGIIPIDKCHPGLRHAMCGSDLSPSFQIGKPSIDAAFDHNRSRRHRR
jgi:hypothetical protein